MTTLTEADEAEHYITYRDPGSSPRTIRAAYVTTEDKHPDMLAFKAHKNRTVLLVNRVSVLAVERLAQGGNAGDRTPITESVFETTSQTMSRAGINPLEMP